MLQYNEMTLAVLKELRSIKIRGESSMRYVK